MGIELVRKPATASNNGELDLSISPQVLAGSKAFGAAPTQASGQASRVFIAATTATASMLTLGRADGADGFSILYNPSTGQVNIATGGSSPSLAPNITIDSLGQLTIFNGQGNTLILKKASGASMLIAADAIGAANAYSIDNNAGTLRIYNNGATVMLTVNQSGSFTFGPTAYQGIQTMIGIFRPVLNAQTSYGGFGTANAGSLTPLSTTIPNGDSRIYDSGINQTIGFIFVTINNASSNTFHILKKSGVANPTLFTGSDALPAGIAITTVTGSAPGSAIRIANTTGNTPSVVVTFLNHY